MTFLTETNPILEKARAGRRVALSSLHARQGDAEKVVSIFDNEFFQRAIDPDLHAVHAQTGRPVLMMADYKAA